jgi:hypothetical protein
MFSNILNIRGEVKKFPEFFDLDSLVLLVISMWKVRRGCAMQFGGSGAASGRQGQWFLHHDNAPSIACCVITQPPYSPDLAPSGFGQFPTLKMGLAGTLFAKH